MGEKPREHKRVIDYGGRTKTYHLFNPHNVFKTFCGLPCGTDVFTTLNDSKKPICKNCLRVFNHLKKKKGDNPI